VSRAAPSYARHAPAATPAYDPLRAAISEWTRLRQSDSLPYSSYAGFLLAHPGWPGETALRRAAERQINPLSASPAEMIRYFTRFPPLTPPGKVRYAEALLFSGRPAEARVAAIAAWTSGALSPDDESRILSRFSGQLTPADHDRRMERLLWDGATTAASRQIAWTSTARRPIYQARLAMQARMPNADLLAPEYRAAAERDAGYRADRARWLRDTSQSLAARNYLAAPRSLEAPPFDAEKWLETLLTNARAAANDNQLSLAYDIARQLDDAFPAGTIVRDRTLGERDDYTSLAWLAGTTALRLGRAAEAVGMFERYARAAQTPQTQSKGHYWAGHAAQSAGDTLAATGYFNQAAAEVDQFYGQLAAERLGRPISIPPEPAAISIPPEQRASFHQSEIVRAAKILGAMGAWTDQTHFIRTIAQNAKSDADHVLAGELASALGRPDLGVMVSRVARNSGTRDPVRIGFPQIPVPAALQHQWTMIHAISRQESQFDRQATSRVGAKGLMQLMPRTAQEQAGKLGLPYNHGRLTSDPRYNVMLGSAYFDRMLAYYGGSHVLAVAAYNAGPGNVNKWLVANGDPRMSGVDPISWIEAIPLLETRGYVQRVLENAVVYELLNPSRARLAGQTSLSSYLGKRQALVQACAPETPSAPAPQSC
jgi:soluble lytic murein transglycosylase